MIWVALSGTGFSWLSKISACSKMNGLCQAIDSCSSPIFLNIFIFLWTTRLIIERRNKLMIMIQIHTGEFPPTKLNEWVLQIKRRRPSIDSTDWKMDHDFVKKKCDNLKKVSKIRNCYLYKGNSNNRIQIQL